MLLLEIWQNQPGRYFCISTKSATGKWRDKMFDKDEEDEIRSYIRRNKDKDLYMTPHGFTEPSRTKEFAVSPHLLYSDLDECDPRSLAIRPTIAIESSPGRYVGYWVTDEPASEELNRRMSYMIGADKSGWDLTQVLRIPNTRNYKYDSTPRVKILWKDGPKYKIRRLEKLIPSINDSMGRVDSDEAAVAIYKKYEDKLDRWARRELMTGKPKHGTRSEVLWKLHNSCLECGMTRDEAFTVLWASPWNKFRERRNGQEQLWRELDKAVDQHFEKFRVDAEKKASESWNPLPAPMSEIEREHIDWLVPGFIPRRELVIVEGDPGLGKSYLMQMIAGHICDGKPLPMFADDTGREPMRVAYFDTENTASTVTKGRLDENRVQRQDNYFQGEEPFSIDDEERWEQVIDRLEELKPALVVFDTINTYIGGADTYRSSETQQAMAFFKQIALRFDCGVVLLRHLTKGGGEKALYRGQGSIAFAGAARIVATVGEHPEEEGLRVVANTKNNVGPKFKSFSFSIEGLPDHRGQKNRSKIVWGDVVDIDADELMAPREKVKGSDVDKAKELIREALSNGSMDSSKIMRMAEARSISRSTMNRAAEAIGVDKTVKGFGKNRVSEWSIVGHTFTDHRSANET